MTLYYRIADPSDLRDISDQMNQWIASGNPKADDWQLAPTKPSESAYWNNGTWEIPEQTKYTANQWVSLHFTNIQLTALADLRVSLALSGKQLGPLMSSMRTWTSSILSSWALDPTPKADWPDPPCTYEDASVEAVRDLSEAQ
jgi:hypothetical protein